MGCAVFYPMLRLDIGPHLYLDNIVVRKKYQRRGVAKALMHRVREEAAKAEMKFVTWQVKTRYTNLNHSGFCFFEHMLLRCHASIVGDGG